MCMHVRPRLARACRVFLPCRSAYAGLMHLPLLHSRTAARCAMLIGAVFFSRTFVHGQPSPAPQPPAAAEIVGHLERTISWFRRVQMVEQQAGLSRRCGVARTAAPESRYPRFSSRSISARRRPRSSKLTRARRRRRRTPRPVDAASIRRRTASRSAWPVCNRGSPMPRPSRAGARAFARSADSAARRALGGAGACERRAVDGAEPRAVRGHVHRGERSGWGLGAQVAELERSVPEARHIQSAKPAASAGPVSSPSAGSASVTPPFGPSPRASSLWVQNCSRSAATAASSPPRSAKPMHC